MIGVLAAVVCLVGLFLFFNYFRPAILQDNGRVSAENGEEVPDGYFDLRGISEVLVDIKGFDFNPRKIVVSPGAKVLWKNGDQVFHSIMFDPVSNGQTTPVNNSGQLKTGETFAQTISTPGTYTYRSSDNPDTMTGTILVK